ncbi:MAG: YcjX family protein, partial [Pseudomonadota bacterium]
MVIGRIADGVVQSAEAAAAGVSETFFEPVIRLGVTGLARAGKTVFITSLVANLMDRGRMPGLTGAATGAIRAAWLQPQPDDTVPRFAYERHLADLTGEPPHWPDSTRAVSQLRLSFRVQPAGFVAALSGPRTVHLDIVDYPGEWLLDLGLMDQSFEEWSAEILGTAERRDEAAPFRAALAEADLGGRMDEPQAEALAAAYTAYLQAARAAGFSDCTPGRFLMPGELAGSPALTFAPLPPGPSPRGSLAREMARRFEAYKREVARPFFRDHFARIDRQVVLIDALSALAQGPRAFADLTDGMAETLACFRHGQNGWLDRIMGARRIDRLLFAATKADHLHHTQHARLL